MVSKLPFFSTLVPKSADSVSSRFSKGNISYEKDPEAFCKALKKIEEYLKANAVILDLRRLILNNQFQTEKDSFFQKFGNSPVLEKTLNQEQLEFTLPRLTFKVLAPNIRTGGIRIDTVYERFLKMASGKRICGFYKNPPICSSEFETLKNGSNRKLAQMTVVYNWLSNMPNYETDRFTRLARYLSKYLQACSLVIEMYDAYNKGQLNSLKERIKEWAHLCIPFQDPPEAYETMEFSLCKTRILVEYYVFASTGETVQQKVGKLFPNKASSPSASLFPDPEKKEKTQNVSELLEVQRMYSELFYIADIRKIIDMRTRDSDSKEKGGSTQSKAPSMITTIHCNDIEKIRAIIPKSLSFEQIR